MELDWSKQSAHIRTLYAPWQPGDGYEESVIAAAENRLVMHLPDPLRSFYQSWGKRKDMTRLNHLLPGPAEVDSATRCPHFCVENQVTSYWAIRREDLEKANPPVVKAWAWLEQYGQRKIIAPLVIGVVDDFAEDLPFYVRPGQALFCGGICAAATSSVEALDELGQFFQFIWKHRW